jgi:peptidoglycan/LPS O-acetylase OafA/YrhL
MIRRQFGAFRGIAIILVILNHSAYMIAWFTDKFQLAPLTPLESSLVNLLIKPGIFAVPIFLFLSGCFFVYAIQGKDLITSWKISIKNIIHILWPYLIWSIAFYIVLYVLFKESYSLWDYVKFLLVGYPNHFIPLLFFFYLIAPLLVPISKRFGWYLIVAIMIYQLALVNLQYPGVFGFQFPDWVKIIEPPVIHSTFAIWGICFPLGIIYSFNQNKADAFFIKYLWAVLIVVACLFLVSTTSVIFLPIFPVSILDTICPIFLLLLIPTLRLDKIRYSRFFEKIGNRSLGLYLMNLIIINLFLFGILTFVPWMFVYKLALVPILFSFTLFFSLAIMDFLPHVFNPIYSRYVFGQR